MKVGVLDEMDQLQFEADFELLADVLLGDRSTSIFTNPTLYQQALREIRQEKELRGKNDDK